MKTAEEKKEAARLRSRAHYEKNKALVLARAAAWRNANRERTRAAERDRGRNNPAFRARRTEYARSRYLADPARYKARTRDNRYRLLPGQFDRMFSEQSGKCSVCGQRLVVGGSATERPHVDHDHTTGQVRALLCGKCNTGIGQFDDSVERLLQAARYLEQHK